MSIEKILLKEATINDNYITLDKNSEFENQGQTNEIFSDKWGKLDKSKDIEKLHDFQYDWYLKLYGFDSEAQLADFLKDKEFILDAGCGLGYKASWFAKLAPQSTVIGMDYSEAAYHASMNYKDLKNLYFVRGDIANTGFKECVFDFVSCDQVLQHTENPEKTFAHLTNLLTQNSEFACYVYAKKALPRELIDDHFRTFTKELTNEQRWELSDQVTQLGKVLSDLKVDFECPDIPLLGIKGGKYDIQRFIYWNFLKCFWREEWGYELSKATNYDWYAPSNAKRYSEEEYKKLISDNGLQIEYFHSEEACYSGRFKKLS